MAQAQCLSQQDQSAHELMAAIRTQLPAVGLLDEPKTGPPIHPAGSEVDAPLGSTSERALGIVSPADVDELSQVIKLCQQFSAVVDVCGAVRPAQDMGDGTPVLAICMAKLNQIAEVQPDSTSISVGAGCLISELNAHLAIHRLVSPWPEHTDPHTTVGGAIAAADGCALTARPCFEAAFIKSVTLVAPDGEILQLAGASSMTNTYDLLGLMSGMQGQLGAIADVTVEIQPAPVTTRQILVGYASHVQSARHIAAAAAANVQVASQQIMDQAAFVRWRALGQSNIPPTGHYSNVLFNLQGSERQVQEQIENIAAIAARLEGTLSDLTAADSKAKRERYDAEAESDEPPALAAENDAGEAVTRPTLPRFLGADLSVGPSRLAEAFDGLDQLGRRHGLTFAGRYDGNHFRLHAEFDRPDGGDTSDTAQPSLRLVSALTGETPPTPNIRDQETSKQAPELPGRAGQTAVYRERQHALFQDIVAHIMKLGGNVLAVHATNLTLQDVMQAQLTGEDMAQQMRVAQAFDATAQTNAPPISAANPSLAPLHATAHETAPQTANFSQQAPEQDNP